MKLQRENIYIIELTESEAVILVEEMDVLGGMAGLATQTPLMNQIIEYLRRN